MLTERPLQQLLPQLKAEVPFAQLGELPTRIHPLKELLPELRLPDGRSLSQLSDVFIKRDDLSAPEYGGNKVRTLEVLLGAAWQSGQQQVYSTGAFGSNHALATLIHARRLGLTAGVMLYPQPPSACALENLQLSASLARPFVHLRHWSTLPLAIWRRRQLEGDSTLVMPPGGATPFGALGYVSAALELAHQVRAQELPSPRRIVLAIGSTCTTAGLLVGVRVARRLGIAFQDQLPTILAVRVTPWPVTSPVRVANLAHNTSQLLARLSGRPELEMSRTELWTGLSVDSRYIGQGYGVATDAGLRALEAFAGSGCALDTTYSAKSAAALLDLLPSAPGPTLYWATKSSAPLPEVDRRELELRQPKLVRWMELARQAQ